MRTYSTFALVFSTFVSGCSVEAAGTWQSWPRPLENNCAFLDPSDAGAVEDGCGPDLRAAMCERENTPAPIDRCEPHPALPRVWCCPGVEIPVTSQR